MEQKIEYDDLIIRYLAKETTAEEEELLRNWVDASDDHKKHYEQIEYVWKISGNYHPVFNRNREEDLKRVEKRLSDYSSGPGILVRNIYKIAAAVAAMVILVIVVSYLLRNNPAEQPATVELISGNDVVHQELPDGSEIWLNRNSTLTFRYGAKNKRASTLDGEAFFQVKPDSLHPFEIKTRSAIIRVIGTSFNVRTHAGNNETEVLVAEGKVSLTPGENSSQAVVLPAGSFARTNPAGIMDKKETFTQTNYLSWKTRVLVFRDTPLDSALSDIGQCYGIAFDTTGADISGYKLTARYIDEQLQDVIAVLQVTLGLSIEFVGGNTYRLSSTEP